jgi:hypothetical protein
VDWRPVFIGVLALGLGVAVYVLDRSSGQTYFLPDALSLHSGHSSVFGKLGDHLPTFLHVFAFCLISSGILNGTRRGMLMICLFWLFIDAAFEIGQHPSVSKIIIPMIPDFFFDIPVLDNTANYFAQGRFDPVDLLSIFLGAACAYLLMRYMSSKPRRRIGGQA